jgi:hypothetical protein
MNCKNILCANYNKNSHKHCSGLRETNWRVFIFEKTFLKCKDRKSFNRLYKHPEFRKLIQLEKRRQRKI